MFANRITSTAVGAGLALLLGAGASLAGPFSDVPRTHWAYEAIQKAVDAGVLQGFDGRFAGDRTLNRYQLAVVVKKLLEISEARGGGAPGTGSPDLDEVRALSLEFSDELALLGVKVGDLEQKLEGVDTRLTKVEASGGAGNVATQGKLTVSGQIRVRPEYNNNYDFNSSAADSRDFYLFRSTVGLRWDRSDRFSAFIQLRDSRAFGAERNATGAGGGIAGNTATSQANVDLHQGYVDYRPGGDSDWTFRLGRQEVVLGDERLIGGLDWSNTGRAFDGLVVTRKARDTTWRVLALQVADLATGATGATGRDDQRLSGLYNTLQRGDTLLDYYLLYFDDQAIPAATTGGGDNEFYTLGFRWKRKWSDRLDSELELAVQDGDLGAMSLSSRAMALKLGFATHNAHKGRIELEYDWSPGDENAGDQEVETFQNMFPTNHKFYGIADRLAWMNMRGLRLGYAFEPSKGRKWKVDLWKFDLDETTDSWYQASGGLYRAAVPLADSDVGMELDVRHSWTDGPVKWEVGVARFFAGDFQTFGAATPGDDATFAYTQILFPF